MAGRGGGGKAIPAPDNGPCEKQLGRYEDDARDPEGQGELVVVCEGFGGDRDGEPDWLYGKKNAPGQRDEKQYEAEQHRSPCYRSPYAKSVTIEEGNPWQSTNDSSF